MSVDGISSNNSTNPFSSDATTTKPKTSEKDMFMTLLVAQLKNQDPLEPQDGAAFVAQLAQFNSLDQLVGIRESIAQLNTYMQQATGETASTGA